MDHKIESGDILSYSVAIGAGGEIAVIAKTELGSAPSVTVTFKDEEMIELLDNDVAVIGIHATDEPMKVYASVADAVSEIANENEVGEVVPLFVKLEGGYAEDKETAEELEEKGLESADGKNYVSMTVSDREL